MSDEPRTTVLNPLEQLALSLAGKWKFIMSESPDQWHCSRSFVRLDTDGQQERMHVDYAINIAEPTRKHILLRRTFTVLAAEEKRLYALSDAQAIAELDALSAVQDAQSVRPAP